MSESMAVLPVFISVTSTGTPMSENRILFNQARTRSLETGSAKRATITQNNNTNTDATVPISSESSRTSGEDDIKQQESSFIPSHKQTKWRVGDVRWSTRRLKSDLWLPADGAVHKRIQWPQLAAMAACWDPPEQDDDLENSCVPTTALFPVSSTKGWGKSTASKTLFGDGDIFALAEGNGTLIAAGVRKIAQKTKGTLAFSKDGVHWTDSDSARSILKGSRITDAAYGQCPDGRPLFMVGTKSGALATSPDGNDWTLCPVSTHGSIQGITYGLVEGNRRGLFVALDQNGTIHTSSDGQNWNAPKPTDIENMHSWLGNTLTWGPTGQRSGLFMAGDRDGKILTSRDGMTWTCHMSARNALGNNGAIRCLTWGRRDDGTGLFMAGSNNGKVAISTDGHTWTAHSTPLESIFCATWIPMDDGGSLFVVGGYGGSLLAISADGWTWTDPGHMRMFLGNNDIHALAYGQGKIFLGGSDGLVATHNISHKTKTSMEMPAKSIVSASSHVKINYDPVTEFTMPNAPVFGALRAYVRAS